MADYGVSGAQQGLNNAQTKMRNQLINAVMEGNSGQVRKLKNAFKKEGLNAEDYIDFADLKKKKKNK